MALRITDEEFVMNLSLHNKVHHNGCVVFTDPLQLSSREALPFPTDAATRLASHRSKRYDNTLIVLDDAEKQLQLLAAIMGMLPETCDYTDFTHAA